MSKENFSKQSKMYKMLLSGVVLGSSLFGCAGHSHVEDKNKTSNEWVFSPEKTSIESKISEPDSKDDVIRKSLDKPGDIVKEPLHKKEADLNRFVAEKDRKPKGWSRRKVEIDKADWFVEIPDEIIKEFFSKKIGVENKIRFPFIEEETQTDMPYEIIKIPDEFIKEYKKIGITENKTEHAQDKSENKKLNIIFPFLLLCAGAGGYFLINRRKRIKKYIKFLVSLPKLAMPGITKEDVYTFLKEYRPSTPDTVLKLISNQFMKVLPDSNMFSPLEIMILANTIKNNFTSNNDLEFCSSVATIVEKYDRSVLSYKDFLSTVRRVAGKNIKLFPASEEIKESLVELNKSSKQLPVYSNKKKYDCLLRKADEFGKNAEDSEAQMVLEEAVLVNPGRSEAYFRVSEIYDDDNRFEDAVHVLDDLIAAEPCKPVLSTAYLKRADLFLARGNYNAALQDLNCVDNGDYRKYRIRVCCIVESGNITSGKEELAVLAKEFFHCYVAPGLAYWASKKNSRKENC